MGCPIQAPPAAAPGGMASINAAVSPPGSIPTPWAGAQSAQEAPSLAPPQPPQQQQQPDAQRQQRLLQLQALLDAGQLPLDVANSVSSVLARARANGLMPPAATSAASAGTVLHNPFQQGGWVTAPMQASMQPYSSHAMHVSAWPASMGGMSQGQHHGASGMQPSYYQTNMITHGQQQMSGHMGGASMQPQAAATAGRGSGAQRKSQPSSPAKRPQGGRSGWPLRNPETLWAAAPAEALAVRAAYTTAGETAETGRGAGPAAAAAAAARAGCRAVQACGTAARGTHDCQPDGSWRAAGYFPGAGS